MLDKHFHTLHFNSEQLHIDRKKLFAKLGYINQPEDPYLHGLFDSLIPETIEHIQPTGGLIMKNIDAIDQALGTVTIEGNALHVGKIICSQISKSTQLALFICTLGKEIEFQYESYFQKHQNLEGYIMNLAASEAVESLAELMQQYIREESDKIQLTITNRFSPGYCTWNVIEQFKLFEMFPPANCGVQLTKSALMNPIKSISAIVGIGAEAEYKNYPCTKCSEEDCLYRNTHS